MDKNINAVDICVNEYDEIIYNRSNLWAVKVCYKYTLLG